MENLKHKIGWKTATAIVISNMIGTGVFTTLGFQLGVAKTPSLFFAMVYWWCFSAFRRFVMQN